MEEVQQGAQGGCRQLRGPAGLLGAARHHERRHVSLAESLEVQCHAVDGNTAVQKWADRIDVTAGGRLTQPPFHGQVAPVAGQGLLNRPGGKRCRREGGRALLPEVRQQRTQRLARQMTLVTGVQSGLQKLLRRAFVGQTSRERLDQAVHPLGRLEQNPAAVRACLLLVERGEEGLVEEAKNVVATTFHTVAPVSPPNQHPRA